MAPEYMTEALDETAAGHDRLQPPLDRVLELKADVIAVGPGLGQDPGHRRLRAGDSLERAGVAAGARCRRAERVRRRARSPAPGRDGVDVIITPHPGRDGAAAQHQHRSRSRHDRLRARARVRRRAIASTWS